MSLVYKEVFEDGYPVECEWAMEADSADLHKMRDQLRAHAAELEEIERLKGERDVAVGMMNVALDQREQAERRCERLKFHAEAMANAIQFGDMAILTVAKAAADSYRSDYPKDPK